jgi:hypothetical protein
VTPRNTTWKRNKNNMSLKFEIQIDEYADEYVEMYYFRYAQSHRDNGPSVIVNNGYRAWYQYGERHRDIGAAMIYADGEQRWYTHGKPL